MPIRVLHTFGDEKWELHHTEGGRDGDLYPQTIVAGVDTDAKAASFARFCGGFAVEDSGRRCHCQSKVTRAMVFSYPQENPPERALYFVPTEGAPIVPSRKFECFRDTDVWYMVDTHVFMTQAAMGCLPPALRPPCWRDLTIISE